jgi:hypothetical protein
MALCAPCGTGARSTVSNKIRRQQYGGMIIFGLAELKGKSFVEKGMQLHDIPAYPSFFRTPQATLCPPLLFSDSTTLHQIVRPSGHAPFMNLRFVSHKTFKGSI